MRHGQALEGGSSSGYSSCNIHNLIEISIQNQYISIIDSLGDADLSAHVDFNALKNAVIEKNIKNVTISSQHNFLVHHGIIIRQKNIKNQSSEDYDAILDNQLYRLISKKQMGEMFKVMEYTSH